MSLPVEGALRSQMWHQIKCVKYWRDCGERWSKAGGLKDRSSIKSAIEATATSDLTIYNHASRPERQNPTAWAANEWLMCVAIAKREMHVEERHWKKYITSKKKRFYQILEKISVSLGNWKCLENSVVFVRNLKNEDISESKLFLMCFNQVEMVLET